MSSRSKAVRPSDRNAPMGGGSACSIEDTGQRPRREGAEQGSLPGRRGHTAAPEAEITVFTKLARLVALLLHDGSVLGSDSPSLPDPLPTVAII
jgi:hypothetical protein